MVHTLKTVGDLLELCKRLPEDMELREFYFGFKNETQVADHIKVMVVDVGEENVALEVLSASLELDE